jgi:hypothetical protein
MFRVHEKRGAETTSKQAYLERSGINPLTLLLGWPLPACFANSEFENRPSMVRLRRMPS